MSASADVITELERTLAAAEAQLAELTVQIRRYRAALRSLRGEPERVGRRLDGLKSAVEAAVVEKGLSTVPEIAAAVAAPAYSVSTALTRLKLSGRVVRLPGGGWGPPAP